MRVITPIANPKEYVKNSIADRKIITRYKNYNRCCYLLNNGKRCKNPVIGDFKTNKGTMAYVMRCKVHGPICKKKYIAYKSVCGKVIGNVKNLKRLKTKSAAGNVFKRISLVKNCADGRIDYPKRCMMGCVDYPGSKRAKVLIDKRMKQHEFITDKLKELEKYLLYGNKLKNHSRSIKNNIVPYILKK